MTEPASWRRVAPIASRLLLPAAPAVVAGVGRAAVLTTDGELLVLPTGEAARLLRSLAPPLLVHAPATLRRLGLNLPAAGGAYFRLLPYGLVRAALHSAERRGHPGTFYVHPWEYDPEQPRFDVPALTRVRHYGGLSGTWERLERLLGEFRFSSIAAGLPAIESAAA